MSEQTLKEKTAKGLFWGGLSNGVQQLLNLVFGLILARLLNPGDYGMIGMLIIFTSIASTIQESGFTTALINQKEIRKEDYNAVFWFSTLIGLFFYVVLFFTAPLIADFYKKTELINLSRVFFLSFVFGGLGVASNAYLCKNLMVKERAKIDIFALLCSGIIGIILVVNGFAYYGLAIQTIAYISVGSFLKIYYAPWKPEFRFNFIPLKVFFSFGSKLLTTNIFVQFNNNLFAVILGKFFTVGQLGVYSQGQKWMSMGCQLVGGMVNSVAQPIFVQMREDEERQRLIFRKMMRLGAFLSFPMMFGLAFVSREFVLIFLGNKWLDTVQFLQLFCIWGGFAYMMNLYSYLLLSYKKVKEYMYGIIIMGMSQIILVYLLFSFGIYIIVISYIISNFTCLLFFHYCSSKLISIKLIDICKDIFPYFVLTILSFLFVLMIVSWTDNIYIIFCVKILLSCTMYVSVLYMCKSVILQETIFFLKKLI